MPTVSADFESRSEAELIDAVRSGTLAAYGTLYQRHVGAAYTWPATSTARRPNPTTWWPTPSQGAGHASGGQGP